MAALPPAKKELGQHWLEDQASLHSMIVAANITSNDTVLEIGPGTGTLTDELLKTGAHITTLEFDRLRTLDLQIKYKSSNVTIVEGDIRNYDLSQLAHNYKIVANIPYYLTANLLRKLSDDNHKPIVATLLVQKEVAERVAASPGQLSQVAIFVQINYQVTLGLIVPAYLFTPPPKIDSQIITLSLREKPLFTVDDTFKKLVKAGFSEKRKKLRSSLSSDLKLSKDKVGELLASASIRPDARAQELSLPEWHRLAEKYKSISIDEKILNK